MSNWIKCSERLPEVGEWVLIFDRNEERPVHDSMIQYVDSDYGTMWICDSYNVTHWMPLPDPPEEEKTTV